MGRSMERFCPGSGSYGGNMADTLLDVSEKNFYKSLITFPVPVVTLNTIDL